MSPLIPLAGLAALLVLWHGHGPQWGRWRVAAAVLATVGVALAVLVPRADAYTYSCPNYVDFPRGWSATLHIPVLLSPTGTTAEQIQQLIDYGTDQNVYNLCRVEGERLESIDRATAVLPSMVDALDRIQAGTLDLPAKVDALGVKLDTLHDDLAQLHDDLSSRPLPVEVSNPMEAGDTAAAVISARDWLHADVWWMIGLGVVLFFGYFFVRLVLPRA